MLALKNRLFIDTETDGVREDRLVWDVGLVHYDSDGERHQYSWLIEDVDLGSAEPNGLTYAHFRQRHPKAGGTPEPGTELLPEAEVAKRVFALAFGAVAAGIVVNFDTTALDSMLRRNGYCMTNWHHLVCVENRALGAMQAHANHVPAVLDTHRELLVKANQGKWDTDTIAAAYGITLPDAMRHTAIGDAILAEMIHLASVVQNVIPVAGVRWMPPPAVQIGLDLAYRVTKDDFTRQDLVSATT